MTRITFQFIPLPTNSDHDIEVNHSSDRVKRIDDSKKGMTVIKLRNGDRIEYDISGHLRYSTRTNQISEEILDIVYESTIESIGEVFFSRNRPHYSCLLLNDENVVQMYLDNTDEFSRFAMAKFGNSQPQYTEMDDQTVKISFGRRQSRILV